VVSGRRSPELGLAAAPGQDDLPRRHGRQDGGAGTLVAGSPRVEGRRGRPVAVGAKLSGGARHARYSGRGGEERGVGRSAV
jgi:hypothetical protein